MSKKPPKALPSDSSSPTLEALLEKYSRTNFEPLISYANAVKGSRTEWAVGALQTIAHKAEAEVLSYKDGSVEVTVDGETLRVLARKMPRRDEYQLWVAESSLAALDRLLIARRARYYNEHGLAHEFDQDTTLHADVAARIYGKDRNSSAIVSFEQSGVSAHKAKDASKADTVSADSPIKRKIIIDEASPEEEGAKFELWARLIEEQTAKDAQPPAAKTRRAKKATNERAEAIYERDIVVEDLINILEEKLKDPRSKKTEDLRTADDFTLVINLALKKIDLPQSEDENCHIGCYEKPFGLAQMYELRDDIDHRMRKNPRTSASLRVLMHAIDETMQQFWNERPLNFRPTGDASRGQ